ncbi:MAG TPA: hypothetical protein VL122_04555 [Nitrospirota bacterium]|nr:hypothetical protein [Nitrospirota bacterium]
MMITMRIKALLTTVALVAGIATASFAQQAPPGSLSGGGTGYDNPAARGGALSDEKREAIRRKIEAVRIWRLTEVLNLDTVTSAKLAAYLSSMDQQRMELIHDQMMTMRELRRLLNTPKPDEQSLKVALSRLGQSRHAVQELRDKELNGLKDILTTEQQARYVLFQQEFQREIREMIAGARRRGAAGRGQMGNGPGGPP